MAIVVIGGLACTSTVLSLLVVPVVFTYMDDLEQWLGRTRRRLRGWRHGDPTAGATDGKGTAV